MLGGVGLLGLDGVLAEATVRAELIIDFGSRILDSTLSTDVLTTNLLSIGVNGA